ncbi:MAG: hypothetical protein PWQ67_2408 [Clostridia bacterium]|nr:hypothetical protein [Clostridia bacterium]MDN5323954.1 hypothetical protein [Clostridia bacterium]
MFIREVLQVKNSFWIYTFSIVFLSLVLIVGGCLVQKSEESNKEQNVYPNRPIEVVVGWGAGGGSDIFARAITKPVADKFSIPINVKNLPGASGTAAGNYLLQQPADGYTIWAMTTTFTINSLLGRLQHDYDEFIPLARIQHDTHAIQVSKDSPFQTIDQMVEFAKEYPGQLTISGSGSPQSGSPGFDEIVVTLFEEAAGIDLNYVPFEDAGQMHNALLKGQIDLIIEEFGPTIKYIKEEKIRPLVAFSDKKIKDFPKLPIAVEKGWDVTLGVWRGLMIKAGTPVERVKILEEAFQEAFEDPGYKETERLRYWNLRSQYLGSEEFSKALKEEMVLYEKILKKLGYIK